MATSMRAWLDQYADALGVPAPSDETVSVLLELAGVAARASERVSAPVSCWLVAQAGMAPADALAVARGLAGEPDPEG